MQTGIADKQEYALVTGGSQGIGRAIAEALAKRGYGLLLVALPDESLQRCHAELSQKYNCPVHVFATDLCADEADKAVFNWVKEEGFMVSVLVNNAGYGSLGDFGTFDRDFYNRMMHINMINVVGLTRLLFDMLKSRPRSYILNVGSIASFFPIPYKIIYASSKYFIFSFSRALREELRGSNISVSLLCPGPVNTNANVKARIECAGYWGKKTALNPEIVGRQAVKRMLRGRWLILPGLPAKVVFCLARVIPTIFKERMLARQFRRGNDQI